MLKVLNSETQQLKTLEDRNAMLERDVQRFNERKDLERQVGFLLSFPSGLLTVVTLDCALRAHSPIYGIHGIKEVLHRRESETARPPQARPDTAAEEPTHA